MPKPFHIQSYDSATKSESELVIEPLEMNDKDVKFRVV